MKYLVTNSDTNQIFAWYHDQDFILPFSFMTWRFSWQLVFDWRLKSMLTTSIYIVMWSYVDVGYVCKCDMCGGFNDAMKKPVGGGKNERKKNDRLEVLL